MKEHRELERKLEMSPDLPWPDLAAVPALARAGVAAVVEREPVVLDAVYHDTVSIDALAVGAGHHDSARLDLLRRGVTLRRRTGDAEPGWHLKLPSVDGSRTEIQAPLRADVDPLADRPPERMVTLTRGIALGRPLAPVARLTTRRVVTDLLDESGDSLVQVARDDVEATALADGAEPRRWSEVEVEATGRDDALVDAVAAVLIDAGAAGASSRPKLARALDAVPPAPMPRKPTAGDVLGAYLRAQADALILADPDVRRDIPDAVHRARVAGRRLRAVLAAYRRLFDDHTVEALREELRWWGSVLGEARDAEVRGARLAAATGALPDTLVMGDPRADLVEAARSAYRAAWERAVAEQDGPRYLDMLVLLDGVVRDPPYSKRARRPASKEMRREVRRAWRRLVARHEAAEAAAAMERPAALHEERKAAKRARYAAEAAQPALGRRAKVLAARLNELQDALGTHHDAMEAAERLRAAAARAHEAGEPSFTHGVLAATERSRAAAALVAHGEAWRRATRGKVPRWIAG